MHQNPPSFSINEILIALKMRVGGNWTKLFCFRINWGNLEEFSFLQHLIFSFTSCKNSKLCIGYWMWELYEIKSLQLLCFRVAAGLVSSNISPSFAHFAPPMTICTHWCFVGFKCKSWRKFEFIWNWSKLDSISSNILFLTHPLDIHLILMQKILS